MALRPGCMTRFQKSNTVRPTGQRALPLKIQKNIALIDSSLLTRRTASASIGAALI